MQPYRLIHHHGNWYLAAVHSDTLKVYRLRLIDQNELSCEPEAFEQAPAILQQLEDEGGIWFGHEQKEVHLSVAADAALYFKQRRLFPKQQILEEKPCGSLLISCQIRHHIQLYPLVRYWIPYVKIVAPLHLQTELEQSLSHYLH